VEVGGAKVEYNAKLTSQGILHRDTRIVAHLDIHSAQEDLTSVIKWELVFSLGQAVRMAGILKLWIRMATDCLECLSKAGKAYGCLSIAKDEKYTINSQHS